LGTTASSSAATTPPPVTATITPNTGLTNGEQVTISASGLAKSSIGNILECNTDKNQPNVMDGGLVNASISVSCNAPSLSAVVTTSATGTIDAKFTVIEGTVGPPCGPAPAVVTCPATDANGNSPTADAALYPCPPTAAQQAIGDTCTLTFGDEANDNASGDITFQGQGAPPTTTATTAAPTTTPTTRPPAPTTTVAPATGSRGATTPTTSATPTTVATDTPAGPLASTGPGPGVGWMAAIGGLLLILGLLLLLGRLDGPRRALAGVFERRPIRVTRSSVQDDSRGSIAARARVTMTGLAEHFEQAGRRLGDRASDAPAAARGLTRRAASASTRAASWLLGR